MITITTGCTTITVNCCEQNIRVLEDGGPRLTEDNNIRSLQ